MAQDTPGRYRFVPPPVPTKPHHPRRRLDDRVADIREEAARLRIEHPEESTARFSVPPQPIPYHHQSPARDEQTEIINSLRPHAEQWKIFRTICTIAGVVAAIIAAVVSAQGYVERTITRELAPIRMSVEDIKRDLRAIRRVGE